MTVTKSDVIVASNGGILGPIEDTETWATHFTNRGWSTPDDQIAAGYPIYAQPAQTADGYYEEDWDYGSVLAMARITVSATWSAVAGSPSVEFDISYKQNSGDPWTTVSNTTLVMATSVRYFKVKARFLAAAGADIAHLTSMIVRLDLKQHLDSGRISAASGDAGGTTVNFNLDFRRVNAINVTVHGTSARHAVVDFTDIADPASFKVLVFDTAGTRQTADVSWEARGTL